MAIGTRHFFWKFPTVQELNADWAGAYAAYKELKPPSVAQFYHERLAVFVIDGDNVNSEAAYN